jgi:RNA-directed DNA polymerase
VLIRLNQIMRGWVNYFRHAVCKHTLDALDNFVWHRVIRWQMKLHRWNWKDVRRRHTGPNGRWLRPAADGIELFKLASVPVTRYLYRGSKIPNPWGHARPRLTAVTAESPLPGDRAPSNSALDRPRRGQRFGRR